MGASGRAPTLLAPAFGPISYPTAVPRTPGRSPSPGGGGGPGIFQQLGDLANAHGGATADGAPGGAIGRDLLSVPVAPPNSVPKAPLKAVARSNAPLATPLPALVDQWLPKRIVIELKQTARWLLYAVLLLFLAGLLTCELLRRHHLGSRSRSMAIRGARR